MNENTKIKIMIVTHNDVDRIDRTMDSIKAQTYSQKDIYIYIIDFGSTDGTYEKLLTYDKYHLGVYRVEEPISARARMGYAAERFLDFIGFAGITHQFTMIPGDTIVPEFINTCTGLLEKYTGYNPRMVICETDIRLPDGSVKPQVPLYGRSFMLDRENDAFEYFKHGYKHRIICFHYMSPPLPLAGRRYSTQVINDRNSWNKRYYTNQHICTVYVNKSMACVGEDTGCFEDTLYNYANFLSEARYYEYQYEKNLKSKDIESAYISIAKEVLWKSILETDRGNTEKAENCILLSEVIYPAIVENKLYTAAKRYFEVSGNDLDIRGVFDDECTLEIPPDAVFVDVDCSI